MAKPAEQKDFAERVHLGLQPAPRLAFPITTPQREVSAVHALSDFADEASGREADVLWSGHWGGSINLWDVEAGSLVRNLSKAHSGCVWALQPLVDSPSASMASASADGAIQLWDVRQAERAGSWAPPGATYALASTGGSSPLLLSAGQDGVLRVWDPRGSSTEPLSELHAHHAPIRSLLVHRGAVWSGSTDGTVRVWDLARLGSASGRASAEAMTVV